MNVQTNTPQVTIESARARLAAGDVQAAEAIALAILRDDPDHAEALHLLGIIRFQTGRAEDGVKMLERAVRAAPRLLAAHVDLGAMLITVGRPLDATAQLRTAVQLDPANVEAQVNLGNALHAQGELQAAEVVHHTALRLDPHHVRGNMSLGNLLLHLRRPQEAAEFLASAAAMAPAMAAPHQFLGNALRDLGRLDEAITSYRRAIALEPTIPDANEQLGLLLKGQGHFEEALGPLNTAATHHARARALECLLRLGRPEEFFTDIRDHHERDATNMHSASLSAFASYHLGRPDPHPFCPRPLEYVRVVDRYTRPGADADFLRDLIGEASQLNAMWEPRGISTVRGFQTGGNLFAHRLPALTRLNHDILEELQRYRTGLQPASMALLTRWPLNTRLHGWYVRLLTGGHQYFHNHPFGWMSGCLYLQMPKAAPAGEGAIEFGLESGSYPPLSDKPAPTLVHHPKPGQIAFFPSSLYHRTIPFNSDEERLCIAFDLLPG
ncbi:MAG: tetratricopeptide repeat protein [Gammaproteobacteria bacterium]